MNSRTKIIWNWWIVLLQKLNIYSFKFKISIIPWTYRITGRKLLKIRLWLVAMNLLASLIGDWKNNSNFQREKLTLNFNGGQEKYDPKGSRTFSWVTNFQAGRRVEREGHATSIAVASPRLNNTQSKNRFWQEAKLYYAPHLNRIWESRIGLKDIESNISPNIDINRLF